MPLAQRRSSRHVVDLPCEVIVADDDAPRLMWATDVSCDGMWIEMAQPLTVGDSLVVCFRPALACRARELIVFAQVARCSLGRRDAADPRGMGLSFLDLTGGERWSLLRWLRPRPELQPRRRIPGRAPVQPPHPHLFDLPAHPFASRIN
jgi:hypothetical protein